jgi:hypothetical protein
MEQTLIPVAGIHVGALVALASNSVGKVVNVRDGRDAGGEYKIVVVEIDEDCYLDYRFYGDLSKRNFVAAEQ